MIRRDRRERDATLLARLGAASRKLREEKGLSLEAAARLARIDKGQLGKFERGEGGTTLGGWWDIAHKVLGMPLCDYFRAAFGTKVEKT